MTPEEELERKALESTLAPLLWFADYVPGIGDKGDYATDPRDAAKVVFDAGWRRDVIQPQLVTNAQSERLAEEFGKAWGFRAETRSRAEMNNARHWFNRGIEAARIVSAVEPHHEPVTEIDRDVLADVIAEYNACGSCSDPKDHCGQCLGEADALLAKFKVYPR